MMLPAELTTAAAVVVVAAASTFELARLPFSLTIMLRAAAVGSLSPPQTRQSVESAKSAKSIGCDMAFVRRVERFYFCQPLQRHTSAKTILSARKFDGARCRRHFLSAALARASMASFSLFCSNQTQNRPSSRVARLLPRGGRMQTFAPNCK